MTATTTCIDCGRRMPRGRGGYCEACRKRRQPQRAIRSSARWTAMSRAVRLAPCARCGRPSEEADHIVPLAVDPSAAFLALNVRPLCRSCHRGRRE